jgi:hypothetical protein
MAAVRFSHKRVFPGEGIMVELIFVRGKDPVRSSTCRRRDLATILAAGVVLLQTPAVASLLEVGLS